MKKIGLTGGIGSGKTFVASVFEKLLVPVYYSDNEAKRLMNENEKIHKSLVELLGDEVYIHSKELNRPFLAKKIFSDKNLLAKVNGIIHPVVRQDFNEWAEQQTADYVLQESAILFEINAYKLLDKMILVWAPDSLRMSRVVARDNTSEEEVKNRMKNQWLQEEKMKLADFVIKNDEKEMLLPQIIQIHEKLRKSN